MASFLHQTVLSASLIFLCSCSAADENRLRIRPEEAFGDTKQVELARAAEDGNIDAIERFVKNGADVNAVGRRSVTPLWYAFSSFRKSAFEHLLKLGADPNAPSETGEPLIGYCIMIDDNQYLRMALAHGGNPNALNEKIKQPIIFRAVGDDKLELLEVLINAGANINIRRGDGATPVVFASSSRQIRSVLFLLKKGADPYLRNTLGVDLAAGIFGPNWDVNSEAYKVRGEILMLLEQRGVKFDWAAIGSAEIRNLAEAAGIDVPMWLKGHSKEPNPQWVKANPEKAEIWYQQVLRRGAPK